MLRKFYASGLTLMAVVMITAGCAATSSTDPTDSNKHNWAKKGASLDEITQDLKSCRQQEHERSAREGYNTPKIRDVSRVTELIHLCMEKKGYREK